MRNQSYENPCLTMHQPWASLLVHGIKRIEGRSWPTHLRGRIWIHAAGKVPDAATVKAMEDFYREIYAVDGIHDITFPDNYPVSRLTGCVEVVGCVKGAELESWQEVPEGVRLEALTNCCWLCEKPQKLLTPLEMRGNQGIYELDRKIFEAALKGLVQVETPLSINFPLPNPRDRFSLKPGSISRRFNEQKLPQMPKSQSLIAAIEGARAAATQFSKKDPTVQGNTPNYSKTFEQKNKPFEPDQSHFDNFRSYNPPNRSGPSSSRAFEWKRKPIGERGDHNQRANEGGLVYNNAELRTNHNREQSHQFEHRGNNVRNQVSRTDFEQPRGTPRIFNAAVKGLRPT